MLDERGLAVFLMLISIAASYLVGGVLPGIICLVLAAMIAVVLWTPVRGWLGIPSAKSKSTPPTQADEPGSTVIRVRDSTNVRANRNVGIGTDSVVEADNVTGLEAKGNVGLQATDDPGDPESSSE